jgi:hypothetical protein
VNEFAGKPLRHSRDRHFETGRDFLITLDYFPKEMIGAPAGIDELAGGRLAAGFSWQAHL